MDEPVEREVVMVARAPGNDEIAEMLERVGDLLEAQDASVYRVRAYRRAAATVRAQDAPLADRVLAESGDRLESLPGIGRSIGALIEDFVSTGRAHLLERLEGEFSPADLFATVPGIGPRLAERIESTLHLESLEDLEAAAHDGRLATVEGFGERRVRGVQEALGHMLRFSSRRRAREVGYGTKPSTGSRIERPPVDALLSFDRRYRERAAAGSLRLIAPRRFNPDREAWLPVLHEEVEGWSMTALFSNTARAHELGRTKDWVVIYYERDGIDGQCTVVTEYSGRLRGRRVVRGREEECARIRVPGSDPSSASSGPEPDRASREKEGPRST